MGNPVAAARVFNLREVDELVVFDISARREVRPPDFRTIANMAEVNFVPLTVGGGINDRSDVRRLMGECGADKVALGSGAWHLGEDIANAYGRQSVVFVCSSNHPSRAVLQNCGELIVQSREQDGTMTGYDLEAIRRMVDSVDCPVVASSGCGSFADMDAALSAGADAVAAGAFWQFTKNTPLEAKRYLEEKGWPMRIL